MDADELDEMMYCDIDHIRERPRMYFGDVGASALVRHTLQWETQYSTQLPTTRIVVHRQGEISLYFEGNTPGPCLKHLLLHLDQAELRASSRTYTTHSGPRLRRALLWVAASKKASVKLRIDAKSIVQSYLNGRPVGTPTASLQEENCISISLESSLLATTSIDTPSIADWYASLTTPRPAVVLTDHILNQTFELPGRSA
ncbi:MAG: hypothetical protein KDB14_26290 [Planctomycetales bacterium]|nr:hypothetical protein [Planctomycetales bacterium]